MLLRKITIMTAALLLSTLAYLPVTANAGCMDILRDNVGDVSPVQAGQILLDIKYTDIVDAWVRPADGYPATELGVRTTEPIPFRSPTHYNIFFFFDTDGDVSNNEQTGTRAGSDTAYSLLYSQEDMNWHPIIWLYDPETGEWSSNKQNPVLWASDYGGFIMHVPFDLIPENADWPWRVAVAASDDDGATSGDTYPDGDGELVTCPKEDPEIISGVEQSDDESTTDGEKITSEESSGFPWWIWLVTIVVLAGGITVGKKIINNGTENPPQTPSTPKDGPNTPSDTENAPQGPSEPVQVDKSGEEGGESSPSEEEPVAMDSERVTCTCPTCRAFIVIGSQRDRAIGSAFNLGRAIKRDTESPESNVPQADRCMKVVRFSSTRMTYGERVTTNGSGGDVALQRFSNRERLFAEDGWDDVCLWKEVILVHHGESKSKVKKIINNIRQLIPRHPIERLILYYCGGEGTLPIPEFRSLARELGLRLKMIPEECRPERVHIYMAPSIDLAGEETFTKLVVEQQGLVSFEGKMKHYTVDENGNITEHGNEAPPNGQLFGNVDLGRLNTNNTLDAEAYRDHWRRIARLPLSDIRRYRERIKEAGLEEPPLAPKEAKAAEIERMIEEAGLDQMSADDMERLVERPNREIRRALREYARSNSSR